MNVKYNATKLIIEEFDRREILYRVEEGENSSGYMIEQVEVGFPVKCGPHVRVKFISRDNSNDVAVRVFSMISEIPEEKRNRVLEVCNIQNQKTRFVKFYVNPDGDLNMEYDFLEKTADRCVGEMAFEIFLRTMQILDNSYQMFMKALYTDEDLMQTHRYETVQSMLRQMLTEAQNDETEDEEDEEETLLEDSSDSGIVT